MALMISFILFPVVKKLESWGLNTILAAFFSILLMFLLIIGSVTLFSTQILQLSEDVSDFGDKLMTLFTDAILYFNKNVSFVPQLERDDLLYKAQGFLRSSAGSLVQNTFNGMASFLAGLLSTIIYTFLFLIYRTNLTDAFLKFAEDRNRNKVLNMLRNVQKVGQQYLSGMAILFLILGFANSIGLLIIGIDSPFLFGFLAASLSIIPYVGPTLGATIPVLYAFMSTDSLWTPAAIAGMFWFIQTIESNFLSPEIVGSSMNVNALAAIFSLIVGGYVRGIAGMVLFLPFAAMLKLICNEFEQLQPVALMIGNQGYDEIKINLHPKSKLKGWF